MSNEPKDRDDAPTWYRWLLELRVTLDDQEAVLADLLRRKRNRNLGVREAKRLYRETRKKLGGLLAYAAAKAGEEESGRGPGSSGTPAH
jgi:hypothetical protein